MIVAAIRTEARCGQGGQWYNEAFKLHSALNPTMKTNYTSAYQMLPTQEDLDQEVLHKARACSRDFTVCDIRDARR